MIAYDTLPRLYRIAGRYRIESLAGRGRSSAVYRALDGETQTHVALKILDPMLAQDSIAGERFLREAHVLRVLHHPNVVRVYDLLRDGDLWIICMEWVSGSDGKAYVERYGRMTVGDFLPLAVALAGALDACHRRKIVHRDLKPQNVLITENGDVKLVDFGISKMNGMSDLTRTGTVFGTPQYLAPELFRSARADPRADIYSLGATLYEFLSGRPPYPATSLAAVMAQQMRAEIEPLSSFRDDVPLWLERIVLKCLRGEPAQRYASCYELRLDLERGERAYVTYEGGGGTVLCVVCQNALLAGLPFCHQCGTFRELMVESGRKCLTLLRCGSSAVLRDFLHTQFPRVPLLRLSRSLSSLPRVLLRGISERTAKGLVHQLSVFACEMEITDSLATTLALPWIHTLIGLAVIVPLFWTAGRVGATARVVYIIGAEAAIFAMYRWRTRPLISVASLRRRRDAARASPMLEQIVGRLLEIADGNLRAILARIVRSALAVTERLDSTRPIRTELIDRAVLAAIEAAGAVERQEAYLNGIDSADIRERLRAVANAVPPPGGVTASQSLVELRARLERDLQNYLSIQETHATAYVNLVNLQGVLLRIEDSLQDAQARGENFDELIATSDELSLAAAGDGDLSNDR